MPMLTTFRIALAGVSLPGAAADPGGKGRHPLEHGVDLGHDIFAVDQDRLALGARRATCRTARPSVMLIFSPRNIASIALAQARFLGELVRRPSVSLVIAVLGIVEEKTRSLGVNRSPRPGSSANKLRRCTPLVFW